MKRFGVISRGEPIRAQFLSGLSLGLTEVYQQSGISIRTRTASSQRLSNADQSNLDERQLGDPVAQREHPAIQASGGCGYVEVSRVTDTVRVENPDDPSQYVDVARILAVQMALLGVDAKTPNMPARMTFFFDGS